MTLNPVCESVETAQGVPLTVTGVAQVKIMKNQELLQTASEQFLGKKEHEIKSTVLQTLEGHLRAILGELEILILIFPRISLRLAFRGMRRRLFKMSL
jgi:flotillin